MLECINKKCSRNDNEKCLDKIDACNMRIKPTHTPSYAEEQLNHAIEKENRCYNKECSGNKENQCTVKNRICISRQVEPINYEEEYYKLKKKNEDLNRENTELQENSLKYYNELKDIKHIYYNSDISEVKEENKQLKDRNTLLEEKDKEQEERIKIQKSTIIELKEEIGKILSAGDKKIKELENIIDSLKLKAAVTEKLEIEINNLNAIIDSKDDEIGEMNNCIVSLNAKVEELLNISIENDREIAELKRRTIIPNYQAENEALRCQYEEAKKYIEIKEAEMQKLRNNLEDAELLGKMIKRLVEGL